MDRTDLSRLPRALVDHCIASSPAPPAARVLAIDHSDDPTPGQQEFPFSNHDYQSHWSLPLCMFAGTSHALVTASLRSGTRPTGADNAMLVVRLLSSLRHHWPHTQMLVRGERHCATPEVLDVLTSSRWTDGVFGLAGHAVVLRQAAPTLQAARRLHHQRGALAHAHGHAPPARSRLYDECTSAAQAWGHPWRVGLKAAGRSAGATPRFVVTSLAAPTPHRLYADL